MNLFPQTSFVYALQITLIALSDQSSKHLVKNDPQIDTGGQKLVLLGVVLFAVMVVVVIGIMSPKVEHAIIAALILSLGLISFFLLGH